MADAFVFPGGRVDACDHESAAARAQGGAWGACREAAARELHEEAAVEIDPAVLVQWARWITPSAEPKRFDAFFFVAEVPAGTEARVDGAEVTELMWVSAADGLRRHELDRINLQPPTLRTLEELAALTTIDDILRVATHRPLDPIQPKLVTEGEGETQQMTIVLPWDASFAALPGDGLAIAGTSPLAGGVSRYRLTSGRFVPAGGS